MNFEKTLKSYRNTKINKSQLRPGFSSAFTIVELLIVVVVIAILTAITIVSYNGITSQAEEAAMKSTLRTAANKVTVERTSTSYPGSLGDVDMEEDQGSFTLGYNPSSDGNSYCMQAVSNNDTAKAFFISSETGSIQEGTCDGGSNEIANNTPIQNITQSQCQALPTYTGSDEDALRTVTDARGGTTREYRIAKLADDNCWMLDNLKLGSTTSSITLTPSDSNVGSDFTLPQVTIPSSTSYDNPQVIGPVPSDSGSGATNYGYLYNFMAATAGESRTSMPAGSGNAQHSMCPASWRLPRGEAVPATNEFAMLNAKMNNPGATAPLATGGAGFRENWQHTGPLKGVFAGVWYGSFAGQGSYGYLWSSSAHASNANSAHSAHFNSTNVQAGNSINYGRSNGLGVRCLLN